MKTITTIKNFIFTHKDPARPATIITLIIFIFTIVLFGINPVDADDSMYRENARLDRLKQCNKLIPKLKEYHLNTQGIGTRCATIRTLSKDKLPYDNIMENIHTPSKADNFWEVYYDIKRIRIKNNIPVTTEIRKEVENSVGGFDIRRLANAVARHETASCTKGYGASYNNCFGIKNGNTAPCKRIGINRMCIYDTQEESYQAFMKIWQTWYGEMPTLKSAQRYSGNDRAEIWLRNVTNFYYNQ